jgi:preprotein translocase subunit SecY
VRGSRENAEDVAEDLIYASMITMAGRNDDSDAALKAELARVIPVASILGGVALGVVCVVSETVGVIGGGQGMVLSANIIYRWYEMGVKERAFSPGF